MAPKTRGQSKAAFAERVQSTARAKILGQRIEELIEEKSEDYDLMITLIDDLERTEKKLDKLTSQIVLNEEDDDKMREELLAQVELSSQIGKTVRRGKRAMEGLQEDEVPPKDNRRMSFDKEKEVLRVKKVVTARDTFRSPEIPEAPDAWIDEYLEGMEVPDIPLARPSSKPDIEPYDGSPLGWLYWIDLFRVQVHDTNRSPGEKLAILRSTLKGDVRDIVYGRGGGEGHYKEALRRLKQECGDRDLMKAAIINNLEKLDPGKKSPAQFKKFAERVRIHLFDLSEIDEGNPTETIQKITKKLGFEERLAWNEGKTTNPDRRTLSEFSAWICDRATAYTNIYDRLEVEEKPRSQARSHQVSREDPQKDHHKKREDSCPQCKERHTLENCTSFKKMVIEDKLSFLMKERACFYCLRIGHSTRHCRIAKVCGKDGCKRWHHETLHVAESTSLSAQFAPANEPKKIALGMVKIEVLNSKHQVEYANLLFDEGSDITLISDKLVRKLGLKGDKEPLNIMGITGKRTQVTSERVSLQVKTEQEVIHIKAASVPKICERMPSYPWSEWKSKWVHLADLPLENLDGKVDILLGVDNVNLMMAEDQRKGKDDEPCAIKTKLGWIVRGIINPSVRINHARVHLIQEGNLEADLKRFFSTENFGTEVQQKHFSPEDQRAMDIVQGGIRNLPEKGYEVPLPWKIGEPNFSDNRKMAEARLSSLMSRFRRDPAYEKDYRAAVQKYIDQGYASKVEDATAGKEARFYLPHHGVYKKSTEKKKIRIVFNSAAPFNGKCLNDALITGPTLQNELPVVLTKFREGKIGFTSDIEAMFSRVRMRQEDAKYHSFLWREEGKDIIQTYQMDRLAFGDCCSPFVALYTLRKTAEDFGGDQVEAVEAIREKLYMDDYLDSAKTEEEAISRAQQVKGILSKGDFNLAGWKSNSAKLVRAFQPNEGECIGKPTDTISLLADDQVETKILGVCWKTSTDELTFTITPPPVKTYTRRGLLSSVAGIFDPLGLAAPLTVKAKIKLKELTTRGLDWDEKIDSANENWWNQWFQQMQQLNKFKIPRCLFPEEDEIIGSELHIFGDASEEAFASVVYIRNLHWDTTVTTRILLAKTKLAPKKTISVAKLELQAALLGARLAAYIGNALTRKIRRRVFWTDSSCVRNWIRSEAAYYKPFINHRIGEIQSLTEPSEWRFVPGKMNSSDTATRSVLEDTPITASWLEGPEFLKREEKEWPKDIPWIAEAEEMRSKEFRVNTTQTSPEEWINIKIDKENIVEVTQLKGEFLNIVKRCQADCFSPEVDKLKRGKMISKTSKLLALSPILDNEGILRLGGRINKAQLPYDQRHPVLLPAKHPLTDKIILAFHERLLHTGTDLILTHIRQTFWIIKGREAVKKIARRCEQCIREKAKPVEQMMGELPEERLERFSPPFTRTSIDYFGPIEVGYGRGKLIKRYGAIFTCLTTRAVYLDLAASLSTEDFLLVFRRFVGLYGTPKTINSDNGTNFVGAERELREAVRLLENSNSLSSFIKKEQLCWKFQPPRAPHFGGAHESLVKSTKTALYRALAIEKGKQKYPTEDMLRTLLFEIAGLLNSRPLGYASSDPEDYRPLTPNDFLNRPPTREAPGGTYSDSLPTERYRYQQKMTNLFWDLWSKRYLQSLMERKKWKTAKRNITPGDKVLLVDKNQPRGQWSTGRVIEVFPGDDGLVRVVKVATTAGDFTRAVHTLCLLEHEEETI